MAKAEVRWISNGVQGIGKASQCQINSLTGPIEETSCGNGASISCAGESHLTGVSPHSSPTAPQLFSVAYSNQLFSVAYSNNQSNIILAKMEIVSFSLDFLCTI
ncbi:hypothetical protein L484_025379 [Morus notabilis]|uniref:Uncharacterized protein n=1 Tax=Morus notabilis TaxID=981085 RepID=W9RCT8_9ROSA|nr:hypothetical protein L484_025379 [Morus notabilis]